MHGTETIISPYINVYMADAVPCYTLYGTRTRACFVRVYHTRRFIVIASCYFGDERLTQQ